MAGFYLACICEANKCVDNLANLRSILSKIILFILNLTRYMLYIYIYIKVGNRPFFRFLKMEIYILLSFEFLKIRFQKKKKFLKIKIDHFMVTIYLLDIPIVMPFKILM